MAENLNSKMEKALDRFTGTRGPGTDGKPRGAASEDDFPGEFSRLKLSVIRPTFETIGNMMKERGHEINISEEPGGKISIHNWK